MDFICLSRIKNSARASEMSWLQRQSAAWQQKPTAFLDPENIFEIFSVLK
jgi:hypothetical protein